MTPPEQVRRKILGEWFRKAEADLAVAEHLLSDENPFCNAITFHCQQAAEKFLKAFLIWHEVDFPKTHDLEELLNLVASANSRLADELRDVIVLTPYGVELRCPGDRPDASPAQARESVEQARLVCDKVLPLLPSPSDGGCEEEE